MRALIVPPAIALAALVASGCGGAHAADRSTSAARTVPPPTPHAGADPYKASLAYARCMRQHGVPHPNPNAHGDFHLTYAQEARMRAVPARVREAAQKACFHTLKGLDMRPLTNEAKLRALAVLGQLRRCLLARDIVMGPPVVRNLTLGRAFFGFKWGPKRGGPDVIRAEHACEQKVGLDRKISKIIAEDRSPS
jgi:hypothetical protein